MPGPSLGRSAGRQRRLAAAQRAYGTLPPAYRRVLVLRYVDGLEPQDVAARLGVAEDEVETLLATARNGLLRGPRTEIARPLALAAVAAAFALTLLPQTSFHTGTPVAAAPVQDGAVTVGDGEALGPYLPDAATQDVSNGVRGVRTLRAAGPADLTPDTDTPYTPRGRCKTLSCLPKSPGARGDVVQVPLPEGLSKVLGQRELEVRQEYVPLCSSVPASAPNGVARCVPGSS